MLTYTEFHHEMPLYTADFSKSESRNQKKKPFWATEGVP